MLRANAVYEGSYLLGTSIARPLIAQAQVEVARAEGADAVGHGATGKGNDQVRFELTYAALAPELHGHRALARVGPQLAHGADRVRPAPRHPGAGDRRAPVPHRPQPLPHLLRGRHPRGPVGGAAAQDVPAHATRRRRRRTCPSTWRSTSSGGDPVAVDGDAAGAGGLLERLNRLGGEHGIGRVDLVENRFVGMKSRGVLRDAGRHHPARRPPGAGVDHPGPRGAASARLPRPALRRDDLLRLLVLARARRCCSG